MLRVDDIGDLFYSKFGENEKYLESNVSAVSAVSINNATYVFYLQNNSCFQIEIDSNRNFSNKSKVECHNYEFINLYCSYSEIDNTIYLILTDKNNSNYLLEQINETFNSNEQINATYSVLIETYGEQ